MNLDEKRLERFARHIVLPEIGGAGQVALSQKSVAVIGLGGIGSPALQYLAASGIGRLVLVDDDDVDVSNLQRQTIFTTRDVGHGKAVAARRWLANFDEALDVTISDRRIDRDNAAELLEGIDLVLDGTDNFATRLAVSDSCVAAGIPLLSAAVGRFQGQVGAFAGHRDAQPCYRCFVGDAFDAEDCDTCADDGMLGAMAGWIGTFAAMQAVRILLDGVSALGDPQWGKLHILDGMKPGMRTLTIAKDPECNGCGAG
ncbi:Molybdopterin biosynthesis protein MoeA / Periplasmic molybdate-binding domain [Altererythrobacter epoxidivorans]|uniref:Molybdopterin biosynthesis protein MoeA / Periplasmic molybdate-binding domain n=1 Tax=Altererythrobacter epoxidivorans TaxID=361183 RepID=A0A0M3T9M4_9SPHN|nr:HesA/MoeB/ThiF family protein [Altererythrobacter epoxidivorans]ALE15552.1 Molybdopterin biosynthesis protein MoeA / Periplasmic molybdate-binding domain [Altererythrobacter epoxidivorans]